MDLVVSEYVKPKNLEEAYILLNEGKKNHVIAGGAWLKTTLKNADKLISLDDLGLNEIIEKDDFIEIGAMVTLHEVETSPLLKDIYDGILSRAVHLIMGINIRNIATLGGSVMGKYSFSDVFPVLLVMDASLSFYKHGVMSVEEFLSKKLETPDILTKIIIKREEGSGYFKKVATTPLDFSIINFAVSRNKKGFKIAVGSTPYIAALSSNAMEYLNSQKQVTDEVIGKTLELMPNEIRFNKNIRSSKEYKEELAKVYVKRGIRKVM